MKTHRLIETSQIVCIAVAIPKIRSEAFLKRSLGSDVCLHNTCSDFEDHEYQRTPDVKQINDFVHYPICKVTSPNPCKAGDLVPRISKS